MKRVLYMFPSWLIVNRCLFRQNNKPKFLKVNEDLSGNTFVGELSEIKVNSAQEACQILAAGQQNLKYSATSLNQKSSRSHCIFNIKLAKLTDTGVKVSVFSFCDLAGSERQSKAKTSGKCENSIL